VFRTDLDLKRSAGDARVLLERLVVELSAGAATKRSPVVTVALWPERPDASSAATCNAPRVAVNDPFRPILSMSEIVCFSADFAGRIVAVDRRADASERVAQARTKLAVVPSVF